MTNNALPSRHLNQAKVIQAWVNYANILAAELITWRMSLQAEFDQKPAQVNREAHTEFIIELLKMLTDFTSQLEGGTDELLRALTGKGVKGDNDD